MKIEVDQNKCGTIGICVKECPEVFRFQEGSKKAKGHYGANSAGFGGQMPRSRPQMPQPGDHNLPRLGGDSCPKPL